MEAIRQDVCTCHVLLMQVIGVACVLSSWFDSESSLQSVFKYLFATSDPGGGVMATSGETDLCRC